MNGLERFIVVTRIGVEPPPPGGRQATGESPPRLLYCLAGVKEQYLDHEALSWSLASQRAQREKSRNPAQKTLAPMKLLAKQLAHPRDDEPFMQTSMDYASHWMIS